jgi:LPS O-antigen subunit length determinant protein (WzzB/FepE family)
MRPTELRRPTDDGDSDWRDAYAAVLRRRSTVLLIGGLALVGTLAYCLLTRATYESCATIRLGHVGQLGVTGEPVQRNLVEPVARAIERLHLRRFQDSCLEAAGAGTGEKDLVAILYRKSFTARQLGTTDLVRLTVRAHTEDSARRLLQATIDRLAQAHTELAAPSIQALHSMAAHVAVQLQAVQDDLAELRRLEQARNKLPPGAQFTEGAFIAGYVTSRLDAVAKLEEQKIQLEEQLSEARTYPTSVTDPVRVDPERTAPHTGRNLLIAFPLGLLVGVFVALFRESVGPLHERTRETAAPAEPVRSEKRG